MARFAYQTERRSIAITGTAAANTASTNTNVVAFTSAPRLTNGTIYPVGSTHVAPLAGSGNWLNVVNDAVFGTTFKFNLRGKYSVVTFFPMTSGVALGANHGVTKDCAAANLLAAGTLTPTTTTSTGAQSVFGLDIALSLAAATFCLKCVADIYITDAEANGAQAAAAAGAQGVGVVRLHLNNNAGAVIDPGAMQDALLTAWITYDGDLV